MAIYLQEEEVAGLLDMPSVMAAVEAVMAAHARGEVVDYPRQRVRLPTSMTHMLQGAVPDKRLTGFKVYTSSGGRARFWVHVFDSDTGEPVAVLEADTLGMMRTGAAGGVAAKYLARPDAKIAAIVGAGWQAQGQALALAEALPIETFRVAARTPEHVRAFCETMVQRTGRKFVPAESIEAAVRGADVVVTVTTSPKPVLEAEWLEEGVHVTAAGSNSLARQELPEKAVLRADLICVDSREVAVREAGDLLPALEKGRTRPGLWAELGEVIAGMRPGRRDGRQITLFESQGMAVQDLAVAALMLERARERGLGRPLPY